MMADGYVVGDGSWNLRVHVTDLQVERTLRVKGDLHIGGVMLKLVEDLDIAIDWSDHALWWPARNMWLGRTRSTLDQYGVQADALLQFTPMHKTLRVQLPDLRYLDCRVNFSVDTISSVINICKDLGIRHPEELSLCKPLEPNHLKYNYKDMPKKRSMENGTPGRGPAPLSPDTNTFIPATSNNGHKHDGDDMGGSNNSLDRSPASPFLCAPVSGSHPRTPSENAHTPSPNHTNHGGQGNTTPGDTWRRNGGNANGSVGSPLYGSAISPPSLVLDGTPNGGGSFFESSASSLAYSPATPSPEAKARLLRPKTLVERARLNVAWLDSSLSIMEQGVREFDTLCLRFKFFCFYDLNPKYDAVRINQIYEQAKWQLLNEEIDCTEEEMLMFAALQVQVTLQAGVPQPLPLDESGSSGIGVDDDDEIDAALSDLQVTLEGSHITTSLGEPGDIMQVPELSDYLRFLKPKRFTLKAFKRFWFSCRDLHLSLYKTKEDAMKGAAPAHAINLRGCEVTPEVNLASRKFGIKLEVPSSEGMSEMWIRCDSEEQYAKWMAACRLGAKGRSLADSSYDAEVKSIMAFLQMQRPAPTPAISASSLDINPEDYIAPRFLRKLKGKNCRGCCPADKELLIQRILEAHGNVKSLSLTEAKMNFIRAWQSLPDYGVSLFVVKFMGHRKEELLGVAFNRLMRMDIATGDHLKTWRFNTMKAWNVNWEVKHMMVQFEEGNIIFSCLSADCKVIHEFIGGYIFLSMRSKEANQSLNLEMFHKLTGGWS
ncbi:unc-112-related protein-like isoform X1 [Ischnura elegans]|uniref:unc-112-related protein-like isoform X1 n=1 Tax=Ischnura elegans TaxID=197161 RepID=UPI001ED8B7CF|nr:unc-112-related protein-like isoform X1 [Ischnura elegans]